MDAHVSKVASGKVHASMDAHGWNVCHRVLSSSSSATLYLPGDDGNQSGRSYCMARSLIGGSRQLVRMCSLRVHDQPAVAGIRQNLGGRVGSGLLLW